MISVIHFFMSFQFQAISKNSCW